MKANETNFLKFLNRPQQFVIPIYQRTYSWTRKECAQLWNDIIRVARDKERPGHFIGSIVYIENGLHQVSALSKLFVIDGQQRLTTMSLLLLALLKAAEKSRPQTFTVNRLKNYYLMNIEETGGLRYKLLLTRSDKDDFCRLLDDIEPGDNIQSRILDNYLFFQEQIENSGVDLDTIHEGVNKLIIVDIVLDREHDNPQLIFESLNSTGLELSQADLIRNYVLMGLEPDRQQILYDSYWHPMEIDFGSDGYVEYFNRFTRDYLTLKTNHIPNINAVYEAFKSYATNNKHGAITDIVADIYEHSKRYVRMALLKEPDSALREQFASINTLKVDVAYPLLLQFYDDYSKGALSRDDFAKILQIIESYVFRRVICGIPTNSLNKTFAGIGRQIDKSNYVESFAAALLSKTSYRRFPDNAEFEREFMVKDIYNLRNRNYCLSKLENHDNKEHVNVEHLTIEHIMPQNENLSEQWKGELGDDWKRIHATYLHTIGNLTLTGYNSELSDKPFQEKRDMPGGFSASPVRLNGDLAKIDSWDERAILERAKRLAELATRVWPSPQVNPKVLENLKEKNESKRPSYSLDIHSDKIKGKTGDLFKELRHRIISLDPSVTEEVRKVYIAYKSLTNFVDVQLLRSGLYLYLNIACDEINDPKGICEDLREIGHIGNGKVGLEINNIDQMDYAIFLIKQSLNTQLE